MKKVPLFGLIFACASRALFGAEPPEPQFRAMTIDDKVQIGYGLAIGDVDGDGRPDILLADKKQFVWYRNPGAESATAPWQKFLIAENLTAKDNVCIAAQDIDGDGKCEVAVGAEWNPGDTENSGAVFYLIAPADRTKPWQPVKLHAEPTTHRMRWVKGTENKWALIVVPLHGRGNKNGEGAPVRVLAYHPPPSLNDPNGEWKSELIDASMHMTHNFDPLAQTKSGVHAAVILLCGREGVAAMRRLDDGTWKPVPVDLTGAVGPAFAGAGEVRACQVRTGGKGSIATVEPMHGNQLVFWRADPSTVPPRIVRTLLTDKLVEGHALACGDLLGVGSDQIVVGWRGNPSKPDAKVGIALWTPIDADSGKWRESLIDDNTMACEDLQLGDLNGDGKLDIVASGRATKNLKIYLNAERGTRNAEKP
jgi:hypothetical protein